MYVRNLPTSNNGAVCSPALNFRRVMLNRHQPPALEYRNIWLTNQLTNRSSYVFFQHYNEDGYQVGARGRCGRVPGGGQGEVKGLFSNIGMKCAYSIFL